MAFWHDLAAPVIAGILASMIVNWLKSGSNVSCGRQAAVMAICARIRPQRLNSAAFFVLTAGKAPSRRRSGERTVYPGIE